MYIYIYIFKSNQLFVNICIYTDIRLKRCVYIYWCSYRYISRNVHITQDLLNFNLSSRLCFLLVQANNATKWFLKNRLYMSIYVYICTCVYVICLQIYLYIYICIHISLYIAKCIFSLQNTAILIHTKRTRFIKQMLRVMGGVAYIYIHDYIAKDTGW